MRAFVQSMKNIFSGTGQTYFTKKDVPAAIALGAGITLSLLAVILMQRLEFRDLRHKFLFDAENYSVALEKSFEASLNSLHAIEGLYASTPHVITRARFRTFANAILPHSRGTHALRWVPRVAAAERKNYEAAARKDGFPRFRFTEFSQRKLVTAGPRAEYFPVYFAEPAGRVETALGLDVAARASGKAALEKARDTGLPVATRRIRLILEGDERFSVLVLRPIYRNASPHDTAQERQKNLTGFAMGVFRIDDLVGAALKGINLTGIELSLSDESSPPDRRLLYSNVSRENPAAETLRFTKTLNVADRTWTVAFHATPEYISAHKTRYSWAVLAAGLVSTVLLALYVMSMKRHAFEMEQSKDLLATVLGSRLEEQQVRRMSAERQVVETQLRMLQTQIEPHFLFNTLANIVSLIDKRPESAKKMLRHLTRSLRLSLERSREDTSTLAQEAEMLRDYLSIFKMRLGPRLNFTIDIPPELLEHPFPPMLLQPLVENAVIHGIEPKVEGGRIEIKAAESAGLLRLTVADTGLGFSDATGAGGLGLGNVEARLRALYQDRAGLVLEQNLPCGAIARIEVPI